MSDSRTGVDRGNPVHGGTVSAAWLSKVLGAPCQGSDVPSPVQPQDLRPPGERKPRPNTAEGDAMANRIHGHGAGSFRRNLNSVQAHQNPATWTHLSAWHCGTERESQRQRNPRAIYGLHVAAALVRLTRQDSGVAHHDLRRKRGPRHTCPASSPRPLM